MASSSRAWVVWLLRPRDGRRCGEDQEVFGDRKSELVELGSEDYSSGKYTCDLKTSAIEFRIGAGVTRPIIMQERAT
jgi:hypothetical protein